MAGKPPAYEHHVHPTPAQLEGVPNPFQVAASPWPWTAHGTWIITLQNLEFNWDIAPVPLGTAGLDRVTYAGTNTTHIFKDSKNLDAAWDLLQYMVGPGGMAYFAKTGTPSHKATANSDVYLQGEPENRQLAVDDWRVCTQLLSGSEERSLEANLRRRVTRAVDWGERCAQPVLQNIHDQITPILATPVEDL